MFSSSDGKSGDVRKRYVLDAKLRTVEDALLAANAGRRQDAVNRLQAFVNEVQAQLASGRVTQTQADALIGEAGRILAVLGE